ncbi:helix-turn-helix domain-containing protein [Lentilactobacillus sp. Marseille-Q4993]|uniref:AraC family transcriptional regulator n=1 Tax=Lentilactobacillus sp. Marseille-Q4993 TaxID=3039492 RepID=UPI0024BC7EBB|nr:helix-turn-helix domain-containing protein [Lentilactobacillus sp. Marseille-Q4993]
MDDRILNQLMQLTSTEKKRLRTKEFFDDVPTDAYTNSGTTPTINNYLLKSKSIYVSRHNRFSTYPTHTHTFLEINYMLRGSCEEIVDSNPVRLNQGDILLIDVGCPHSIGYLGNSDLLINILFQDDQVNLNSLKELKTNQSVLYRYLLDKKTEHTNSNRYSIFKDLEATSVINTIDRIIEEYYLDKEFSDSIITSYLSILILQLARQYTISDDIALTNTEKLIANVLTEIDNHYQTTSLEKIATKYGYNRNYLGNLITKVTGNSFSEVISFKRLITAHELITNSKLPIKDVMDSVGIKNKTNFYKKYHDAFGETPMQSRH